MSMSPVKCAGTEAFRCAQCIRGPRPAIICDYRLHRTIAVVLATREPHLVDAPTAGDLCFDTPQAHRYPLSFPGDNEHLLRDGQTRRCQMQFPVIPTQHDSTPWSICQQHPGHPGAVRGEQLRW